MCHIAGRKDSLLQYDCTASKLHACETYSKLWNNLNSASPTPDMASQEVTHRMVRTNGIDMHIAEQGSGPTVLLLHGFPEIWYSWRHQLPALAAAGFHAVAPDIRGYGLTKGPDDPRQYDALNMVADLAGLIEALGEKQVFVVGHDWGAHHAWDLCLLRPHLVRAVICLSVPFQPRLASGSWLSHYRRELGDNFYMVRFQKPGLAEQDYERCGTANALRRIFAYGQETPANLISEKELAVYTKSFASTGWTGALNAYRNMERSWELKAPWTDRGVDVPALFMVGEHDAVYAFPGMREYVHGEGFRKYVPNLEQIVVLEGSHHFIQQERHETVSAHIIEFFRKHL